MSEGVAATLLALKIEDRHRERRWRGGWGPETKRSVYLGLLRPNYRNVYAVAHNRWNKENYFCVSDHESFYLRCRVMCSIGLPMNATTRSIRKFMYSKVQSICGEIFRSVPVGNSSRRGSTTFHPKLLAFFLDLPQPGVASIRYSTPRALIVTKLVWCVGSIVLRMVLGRPVTRAEWACAERSNTF